MRRLSGDTFSRLRSARKTTSQRMATVWAVVVVLSVLVICNCVGVVAAQTPQSQLKTDDGWRPVNDPRTQSLHRLGSVRGVRSSASSIASNYPAPTKGTAIVADGGDESIGRSSSSAVTGRLFFFKGLKKFMWPLFIGFQLVKTVVLALFLPSILGSFGKIVGKGLSSISSFGRSPMEPEDLDFKNNNFSGDMMDSLDAAPQTSYEQYTNPYDNRNMMMMGHPMFDALTKKQQEEKDTISRYGPGGQKVTFMKQDDSAGLASQHDFKTFHEMPESSTLLKNYDPFYSPLLSRLDSVFQQMGLGEGDEPCREKLVCLMYANPAKYAPYSNLVSAQLSRELNQLRKPSTDNTEILRFFRYMRAAREGQEQTHCDHYERCPNLTENTNPAMIKTFNDINKLVQARKLH